MQSRLGNQSASAFPDMTSDIKSITGPAATDFFSRPLAFKHGIVPALIISRVASFCPNLEEYGEPCVTMTQASIAMTFPYLREEAVIKAIHKLVERGLLHHKPRLRGSNHPNKARWSYSVSKEVWTAAQQKLQHFKIEDAVKYGYREAILLWVLEERLAASGGKPVEMSPTELARTVPIGISAISQKLKRLVEEGVIGRAGQGIQMKKYAHSKKTFYYHEITVQ